MKKTTKQSSLKKGLAVLVSSLLFMGIMTPLGVLAEDAPPPVVGTITEFTPLAEEVAAQTVPAGTALADLALPETLTATVETAGIENGTPENTPQELAVSWQSEPAYDGGTAGSYVFTPTLPDGYDLLEGINLPQITVTVGTGEELPAGETEETPSETVPIAPFSLSTDASLLKVAGLTITPGSEAGTSGAPITAAVTVPNAKAIIAATDLVAAAGAIAQLFDDSAFSNETNVALADGANDIYVKVTAEDGITELYYHITVTRVDNTVPWITPLGGALSDGMAGVSYYSATIGSSQMGSLTWTATPSLPDGLSFGPGGNYTNIQGTPSTAGDYTFQLTVTKDGNTSAPVEFSIKVLELSYVWFGGKQWFVVGDEISGVQAPTGALTLLSKDGYGTAQFHSSSREYSGSNLRTQMNAEATALSTGEKASITARNLVGGGGDRDGDKIAGPNVDDALFWPLSINEANSLPIYFRFLWTNWWLRSPGDYSNYAAVVYSDSFVSPGGSLVISTWAIRPALYLNLSSVLFTSANLGDKSDRAIARLPIYKFTMLDSTNSIAPSFTATTTSISGSNLTVSYDNATFASGETRTVSAVVKNSSGEATYYYNLKNITSATDENGTVTINLNDASFNAAAGDTVSVFVEQHNGDNKTDFVSPPQTVALTMAPAITSASSTTAVAGTAATFTVTATGGGTMSYSLSGSVPSGVTINSSTGVISIANTVATGTHSFTITASNGTTPDATQNFTLTVNAAPTFTTQPSSVTKTVGDNASFTVAASGSPAPTLQWQVSTNSGSSWSDISGEIGTTLTLSNVQTSQSGNQYRCRATNSVQANVASNAATLTVNAAPTFTTQPSSVTKTAGDNASFTVIASGSPAPTLQWQVSTNSGSSWSDISGKTGTTLILSNVQISQSGNQYRCLASNSVQSDVASAVATLAVPPAALTGTAAISKTSPVVGDVLSGSLTSSNNTGTLAYEWKVGGLQKGTGATYTVASDDVGKTITLTISSSVQTGSRTSAPTAAVAKKPCPTSPVAPQLLAKTTNSVTLKEVAGYEYSKDGTNWQASPVFTGLTAHTSYTFYQRIATTVDTLASATSTGLAEITQDAPASSSQNNNSGGGGATSSSSSSRPAASSKPVARSSSSSSSSSASSSAAASSKPASSSSSAKLPENTFTPEQMQNNPPKPAVGEKFSIQAPEGSLSWDETMLSGRYDDTAGVYTFTVLQAGQTTLTFTDEKGNSTELTLTLEDAQTPLVKPEETSSFPWLAVVIALALVGFIIIIVLVKRKKNQEAEK